MSGSWTWEERHGPGGSLSAAGEGSDQEAKRGRRYSSMAGGQAPAQAANHYICN